MKLDQILVPVDFSDASRSAVAYAVSLAGTFGARITALHVVEPAVAMPYLRAGEGSAIKGERETAARKHLEEFLHQEISESMIDRVVVSTGNAQDEILRFLETEEIRSEMRMDMVVMGTHGRRAFRRWILGSVTERLLRTVPIPLLTVSVLERTRTAAVLPGGQILYATDLSDSATRGLEAAIDLAEGFGTRLHVLHVLSPIQWDYGVTYLPLDISADHKRMHAELGARLEESIPDSARNNPRVGWELGEGDASQVILDTAERIDAGLIVINLHGRSRTERSKLGRTAESVVRTAHRPVLSLPAADLASKPAD
jgi:nucleotide-binding universal stress UspA family protein